MLAKVKDGEYIIVNEDGAAILPSVWNAIVRPSATISVKFTDIPTTYRASPPPIIERHRGVNSESDTEQQSRRYQYSDDVEILVPIASESDNDAASINDTASDGSVESSTSDESQDDEGSYQESDGTVRDEIQPLDKEGNPLSFKIDTSKAQTLSQSVRDPNGDSEKPNAPHDRQVSSKSSLETLRITKALIIDSESRNKVQLHTLPGPENARLRDSINITWYHLPAKSLAFPHFKDTCLGIPQLSNRLRMLMKEMLFKIEKHKIKAYLGGLFIEPGTVLRVDESCQTNPQSIIFCCVPYYDLQPLSKKLPEGLGDRVFHLRTMMQTFYPYEPVRDRDAEQAYRKFGNDPNKRLVQVPNLWIMNIGHNIVLTCGRKPLAEEMINSIEDMQEDLSRLDHTTNTNKSPITTVRLNDGNGRVNLFSLEACRSYFQMEQQLRTLKFASRERADDKSMRVIWRLAGKEQFVTPHDWRNISRRTDLIFIELELLDIKTAKKMQTELYSDVISSLSSLSSSTPMVPFFRWPQATKIGSEEPDNRIRTVAGSRGSERCLEHVEKSMLEETLPHYSTINAVDKSFASTDYYKSLPEATPSHVAELFTTAAVVTERKSCASHHDFVIRNQCNNITDQSKKFGKIVEATLRLFVNDIDKNTMLRKVWGSLAHIHKTVEKIQNSSVQPGQSPSVGNNWWVRNSGQDGSIPLPSADEQFTRFVKRCKRCAQSFETKDAALEHLQRHLKRASKSEATSESKKAPESPKAINPNDWIIYDPQLRREETNAGALAILKLGSDVSMKLFVQANELMEGVKNEDGVMSDLYTFPVQLLEAFRLLIVFYLAIERALHYTEEAYEKGSQLDQDDDLLPLPFSPEGLERLNWFGNGPSRLFGSIRVELCAMTITEPQPSLMSSLSLGPEYICSWLIRRLIVQPLANRMTIGDMYREYLSTLQFQVNHRPGKRLMRSINLLQEELQVLIAVNESQNKLIDNYIRVLNDQSYEKDIPSRRVMFPYERLLLRSVLENLSLANEDYDELSNRCGPLSDKTKQSLEINEEDHGKAIMVFTIVTIIFLPLSFVTSYLGMNTSDIRDMDNSQSLFWIIALPLTIVTMAAGTFISYNGDELRDLFANLYRLATGKQPRRSTSARGLSVAQRKRPKPIDSSSPSDTTSIAYEAEFASPQPEYVVMDEYGRKRFQSRVDTLDALPPPGAQLRIATTTKAALSGAMDPGYFKPPPPPRPVIYHSYDRRSRTRSRSRSRSRSGSQRVEEVAEAIYDAPLRTSRRTINARSGRVYTAAVAGAAAETDAGLQEYAWQKKAKHGRSGGRNARFRSGYRSMGAREGDEDRYGGGRRWRR